MGISDHLIYLLRNLYAGQGTTIITRHGTMDWFKIGKGIRQGCVLSPCLFNVNAESIKRNAELSWMKAQVGINFARNISNLRHHPNGRKQRGMKETLDEGERGG